MKAFQTILFLAVFILIGGMAALYWGKTIEDTTEPIEIVDDVTLPVDVVDDPVEEPDDQILSGQPVLGASTSIGVSPIILVDDFPEHNDAFGFVANDDGQTVWVDGDTLYVNVGYGGGCQEHEFTLYWNGLWAESAPPRTGVRLVHEGNDDFCEAAIGPQTLQFDLSSITSVYADFHFAVEGYTESISLFVGTNYLAE